MTLRRGISWCVLAAAAAVAAGCGGAKEPVVEVTGRVTDAGRPLEVAGRDVAIGMVSVEFHRVAEDGTVSDDPYTTAADEEGYFEVQGRDGRGIPPGTYRVAVYQWDPYPQTDRLEGRFSKENTPIMREITGDEPEITIDVSAEGE